MKAQLHSKCAMTATPEAADFASLIIHDLKQPLRRIALDSELLEESLRKEAPPEARALLVSIHSEVALANRMVDDVFRAMRGDGRADHEWQRIKAEVLSRLELPASFSVSWSDDLPEVDASLELQYVLRSLITNAVKHHDRTRGRIQVRGRGRTIEVVDDGPGYRRSLQRHADDERMGLGLSLVRRLIEHRGGHMAVDNAGRRGTRVSFAWPRAKAALAQER